MVDYLKEFAASHYTDEEFEHRRCAYNHARPFTKESLYYREIFEKLEVCYRELGDYKQAYEYACKQR